MDMSKDLVAASATPLVLAILAEGDSYGYAIIKRVTELSGGHLQWTDGMLYPVLHRLERQGHVAAKWSDVRERPQAQVLPDHPRRPGAARRPAAAVAGRGRHAAGHLDEGVHGMTTFADRPLEEQIAQWRAYVRRRQAAPRSRRGGARGTSARPAGGAHRGRPDGGRSVPGRGQAHGQPRRAVTRVRTRALRAAVEAAGHCPRRRRRVGEHRTHRDARRPGPCRRRGAGRQGAGAVRPSDQPERRAAAVLRQERQPVRLPAARRLLPVEARVGRCQRPLAGAALRCRGGVRQRLPISHTAQRHFGADRSAPANRPLAGRRRSRTSEAAGSPTVGA